MRRLGTALVGVGVVLATTSFAMALIACWVQSDTANRCADTAFLCFLGAVCVGGSGLGMRASHDE